MPWKFSAPCRTTPGILKLYRKNGWLSPLQVFVSFALGLILSLLTSIGFLQFQMRRYKDEVHAAELEKAVQEAQSANEAKHVFCST